MRLLCIYASVSVSVSVSNNPSWRTKIHESALRCCLEKGASMSASASATASASPASNVLRPLAAPVRYALSSVSQRRRRRRCRRQPSMSSTRSKCVYLGQQQPRQHRHLALTPLARRAGQVGPTCVWVGLLASWRLVLVVSWLGLNAHTNTRTEPGPAQAKAQHTWLLRRAERAARYWNDQWMKCGIKKQHFTLVACILQIRGSSRSLGWSGGRSVGRPINR